MKSENVYLNKISDTKYEIITKDFKLFPKVYKLFLIDDMILLKPDKYEKKEIKPKEIEIKDEIKPKYEKGEYTNKNKTWVKEDFSVNKILDKGYKICENQQEAKDMSYKLKNGIRQGQVIGIKGFDNKYYIYKSEFFEKIKKQVLDHLKKHNELGLDELIGLTKKYDLVLRGVIEIMKEQGDIYEFKKNSFKII
jgi:hypothetical protein